VSLQEVGVVTGGRAWVRTRLDHERATALRVLSVAALPAKSVARLASARGQSREQLTRAALADADLAEAMRGQARLQAETIRLCVHHWEGVYGTDGDALTFPDDVEHLDDADFDALYVACEKARERPDPNSSREP
jgi:hypothetical protein